ncbi:MAG: DUF5752 family protein [Candidatus Altiarchaeota archaeon]
MSQTGLTTNAKVISILLLVSNYILTVNAAPLGTADMVSSRFYWILLFAILVILAAMYFISTNRSPIQVMGLAYDKTSHKLELTVKNNGDERYCIKSALRLVQPAMEVINEATSEGRIPLSAAKASVGDRRLFQLLCEDDSPVVLEPMETKTLAYDILMPQGSIKLDETKNVEVHIAYGEDEGASITQAVSDRESADGFCIRLNSGEMVAEVFLLEDLLQAIRNSPDDAIKFHTQNSNDMGEWVRNVVGDAEFGEKLRQVTYTTPEETRRRIVDLLDSKVESLKHPYLRRVNSEHKFYLKADHNQVMSEVVLLEDLADALACSSTDVVSFHTQRGNDFADWIHSAVGDAQLADTLRGLKYATVEDARDKMVSAIRERVDSLKC